MKIFPNEKPFSLDTSNSIVAYCEQIAVHDKVDAEILAMCKDDEKYDKTLYGLDFVLVSTGTNLNDEVFLREEVYKVYNTPNHKPFNIEHNEEDIIGHIVKSDLLGFNNQSISSDELPVDDFHVICNGVIYTSWRDTLKKRTMAGLIEEIKNDEWKVSMEALFDDFDYGVLLSDGRQLIIPRTEKTSFLTSQLRVFGGSGEYEGRPIRRVLRDITFKGVGLTRKPANPYSIIFSKNKSNLSKCENVLASINEIMEITMSEQRIKELEESVSNYKSEIESLKAQITDNTKQEVVDLTKQLEDQKTLVASIQDELTQLTKERDELLKAKSELQASVDAVNKVVEDMKQAEKTRVRLEKLVNAGLNQEDAEAKASTLASVSDDVFDAFVSMASATRTNANETEVSPTADEALATAEVEETDEDVSGVSTDEEDLRASIRAYIQNK